MRRREKKEGGGRLSASAGRGEKICFGRGIFTRRAPGFPGVARGRGSPVLCGFCEKKAEINSAQPVHAFFGPRRSFLCRVRAAAFARCFQEKRHFKKGWSPRGGTNLFWTGRLGLPPERANFCRHAPFVST